MAVIAMPDERLFVPASMDIQLLGNIQVNRSPTNGALDVVDMIGDSWRWILDYPGAEEADRDAQRGFFNRFRGGAHQIRCWPFVRPVPRGTLRGSPTLQSAAVEGANSIVIAGATGATLLPGDFLNVSFADGTTQLVEVHSATGSGTITATLNTPLRKAAATGSAIYWNKPTADFLILTPPVIPHAGVAGTPAGFQVEMEEFIYP